MNCLVGELSRFPNYRPKEGDSYSADQFHRSLEMVSQQKGDIWVLGDFNYPKLDWDEEQTRLYPYQTV